MKSKILFEETPGGTEFLPIIVKAMSTNRVLEMTYRSYNRPEDTQWLIEPRGLKQYRRRWYLVGNRVDADFLLTFSHDRIVDIRLTDRNFNPDSDEALKGLFNEVVGVFVDPDLDVEDITVRVYGKQRNYFERTPLHHSQKCIKQTDDYSDYSFRLRPEYEFQHEILRLGPDAEVLAPQWLRDDMQSYAEESLKRYTQK